MCTVLRADVLQCTVLFVLRSPRPSLEVFFGGPSFRQKWMIRKQFDWTRDSNRRIIALVSIADRSRFLSHIFLSKTSNKIFSNPRSPLPLHRETFFAPPIYYLTSAGERSALRRNTCLSCICTAATVCCPDCERCSASFGAMPCLYDIHMKLVTYACTCTTATLYCPDGERRCGAVVREPLQYGTLEDRQLRGEEEERRRETVEVQVSYPCPVLGVNAFIVLSLYCFMKIKVCGHCHIYYFVACARVCAYGRHISQHAN